MHGQTGIDLIRENLSREGGTEEGGENFQKGKRGTAKKRRRKRTKRTGASVGKGQAGCWVGPRWRRRKRKRR